MLADRWQRIEGLFLEAVELEGAAREAWLATACAGDAELEREVRAMLATDAHDGDAFSAAERHARPALADPLIGRELGAYRLVERLGEGGMGVVYRGVRRDGLFEQEVAIKLIHGANTNPALLRRFEFERRTLAGLEHPNIARLFDGGTTEEGAPYLVMELVRGATIDRYCASARLPLASRLALFVQVCRAVHHAHQNLVVHCDLKPANILVDALGAPRLLDFGIARLLGERPAAAAAAASGAASAASSGDPLRTVGRVLTPEYASPEQLVGGAVTTALDVYSLGVVLYELTTGRRPFHSDSRSPLDWERLLRDHAPERPSARVAAANDGEAARDLATTPARLDRALRGDLDAITLKALQRDPAQRYASAQELADDIERHLAARPVHARRVSLVYTAGRFVRRNRVVVGAAAAALAALLYGLVAARRSERIAEAEAQHARMEADSFQGVAGFLMDAFLPAQPAQDAAWHAHARELVAAHARRVERQYADEDHVRANMLEALGRVAMRLDLLDDAERLMERAGSIRRASYGEGSLEHALSVRALGQLAYQAGDYGRAVELLERALAVQRGAGDDTHADVAGVLNDLAAALRASGRERDAEALHREALELRRADGAETLPVAESLNNIAALHLAFGERELAVSELREALRIRAAILGEDHTLTLQTLSNLATVLWQAGEADEALAVMRRAEAGYRALRADGEDALGTVLANLSTMQLALRDQGGAAASLEEAYGLHVRRLGAEHPLTVTTLAKLAALDHAVGRDVSARERWTAVVAARRAAGAAPRDLADALYGFGVFLSDERELEAAELHLGEALGLFRGLEPADGLATARCEYVLGLCLRRQGERAAAREHLESAAALYRATPGAPPAELARVEELLGGG